MKTIGKILLMFLLITGISGCEKQNTQPSLEGTVWIWNRGIVRQSVFFVSPEDCFFVGQGEEEYVHYKYSEANQVVFMILDDTKNHIFNINPPQSCTGAISSDWSSLSVMDFEPGTIAKYLKLDGEWPNDIRLRFEQLRAQI